MFPMNNPMAPLLAALRTGKNPMLLLRQMAMQDPRFAQAEKILEGKTPQQIRQMALTMAQEQGTSVEEVARRLGIQIPSQR